MATSKEIRIENLRFLVKQFKTADAVARRAETAPMYLSQILNQVKSSTGTSRGVGDKLARKIEVGCGLPEGWMDTDHGALAEIPSLDLAKDDASASYFVTQERTPYAVNVANAKKQQSERAEVAGSDASHDESSNFSERRVALQLVDEDEALLLSLYRGAMDERARQKIMETAKSAPKLPIT